MIKLILLISAVQGLSSGFLLLTLINAIRYNYSIKNYMNKKIGLTLFGFLTLYIQLDNYDSLLCNHQS